jgi:hypothetical protein
MTIRLAEGSRIVYGPCRYPPEIGRLWAYMVDVITEGECSPNCWPGGVAPEE